MRGARPRLPGPNRRLLLGAEGQPTTYHYVVEWKRLANGPVTNCSVGNEL